MMQRILVGLLLLVVIAGPAVAQTRSHTKTLHVAQTGNVNGESISVDGHSSLSAQVTITGSATVSFQGTQDQTTWVSVACIEVGDTGYTSITSVTTTKTVRCNVAGLVSFRAPTSGNSGSVDVTATASPAVMGSGGGGGGGGGVTTIPSGTDPPETCTPGSLTANGLWVNTDTEELFVCTATDVLTSTKDIEQDTLASVTHRGNTSTGNDETNPFEIFGTGANSGIGHQLFVSSSGDFVIRCKSAAGANKCHKLSRVDDTFTAGYEDKDGTERFLFDGTTGAITKMTVDHTTADVAVTRKIVVTIPLAGCPNGTAMSALNRPGNGATVPTPTCLDAGNVEAPYLSFAGGAVNAGSITFKVPSQFTSLTSVDFSIEHASAAASPTGNIEWDISTVCRAPGETINGTFNAVQTITDAAVAQNTYNTATQTSLTITGCAPGERMTTLISRDGTNDTNNDAAMAFEATWTFIGVE